MITVLLQGGLGNQMFQYGFGMSLMQQGYEVSYNLGHLKRGLETSVHDCTAPLYGLDGFDTHVTFSEMPAIRFMQDGNYPGYRPVQLPTSTSVAAVGYWQSEEYWHPSVRMMLRHQFFPTSRPIPDTKELGVKIADPETVVMHVRRGDYVKFSEFHGLMSEDYFKEALWVLQGKPHKVVIFTDDEPWCREKFPEATIANTGSRHWDLALMAGAHKIVISNSSFGWWGAWLGDYNFIKPGRQVIAPKRWFASNHTSDEGIVPSRWIRL